MNGKDKTTGATAVAPADETIDRERLERRMEFVAAAILPPVDPCGEGSLDPQPISAAELVRRVRPFLGCN